MKNYIIYLLTLFTLSCTSVPVEDENLVAEHILVDYGNVHFDANIPTELSKLPDCVKDGSPNKIRFETVDIYGDSRNAEAPIEIAGNGRISTLVPVKFPQGTITVNNILIMQDNQILYAIPDENDLEVEHFADLTVPFDVEVKDNTFVNGTAFCYTKQNIQFSDQTGEGIFGVQELQTLWVNIEGNCIDIVTVTVDAYRILEIYPFEDGLYNVAIPTKYNSMQVRAYTPDDNDPNDFDAEFFTAEEPYNPDGIITLKDVITFTYDCPEETF